LQKVLVDLLQNFFVELASGYSSSHIVPIFVRHFNFAHSSANCHTLKQIQKEKKYAQGLAGISVKIGTFSCGTCYTSRV